MEYLLHIPKTGGTSLLMSGVVGGHHVKYEDGKKYITIIRNPLEWTISYFQEQTEKLKCKLINWINEDYFNFQTKWLAKKIFNLNEVDKSVLEKIKKILLKDFKVYLIDRLDNDFKLHLNIARKKYSPSESDIELIYKNNNLDRDLYNWVKCNYY